MAVHQRTEFLKRMHAAELVSLAGGLIGMFPTSVQGMAGPLVSQLPITPFNMVCTNVPGPQFPLYLLGHKMLHCYPYVPVGGEMAVNCAILSYNGSVYFGFSGDVHAAPDLRRLENLLMESFTELRAAVGIKPPEQKKPRRKRKVVSKVSAPTRIVPIPVPVPKTLSPLEPKRVAEPVPTAEMENALTQLIVA
jgi:hypothetical protein